MVTTVDVLLFYPNLIGYTRLLCVASSFWFFFSSPALVLVFYLVAFAGDSIDGHVARAFKQTSTFGGVLDMVTDRVSTAGLLILLSHLYPVYTLVFVGLVVLDISSHWFHVLSVSGHHKAEKSLEGRIFIMRWFYSIYPFFAYCCAGTEFFYVLLYAYHFYKHDIVFAVRIVSLKFIVLLLFCLL
jgi:CDP-diacylglycerol--inositol 3-phosphatidyltransferase